MSFITQKGATAPLALQADGSFQSSTDTSLSTLVGTRYDLSDGREVILVSVASTSAATAGYLMQDAAIVANHSACTVASFTAYSDNGNVPASAVVAIGATALTADEYAGGFAVVYSGTGIGQTLRIASNAAAAASATDATLTFEDGPNVSLAANDLLTLVPAHGSNVVVNPTTPTNIPAGVALYNIPGGSYGFLVSKGLTGALSDASPASVGEAIAASVTTAGAVTLATATAGTVTSTIIGNAAQTGVSAKTKTVFVNL